MSKNIAVILSGCGFLDGAEIRESVLTLLSLDQAGVSYDIFSIDKSQHHHINHLKGEEDNSSRNILQESARIARGKIKPLSEANADNYDALVIPGGFGVAKNLSDFAFKGPEGKCDPQFEKFVLSMHAQKKPIGAICIAPAVLSLLFGKDGYECTIGNDQGTAQAIESLGAKHIDKAVEDIHIDQNLKIVSTPAYMFDEARVDQVYNGIKKCVDATLNLA